MRISIGGVTYATVKNLEFAPEVDLTGSTLPINEFRADILTTDTLEVGASAQLYDDLGGLWADYYLMDVWRIDEKTTHVVAQSSVALLDRVVLGPEMYTDKALDAALRETCASLPGIGIQMDSVYAIRVVNGWVPEQTARERLHWLALVNEAYIQSWAADRLYFRPLGDGTQMIPLGQTFWKPSRSVRDVVTRVEATSYAFSQQTPEPTDEYVTNGMEWYVIQKRRVALDNPSAPALAPTHVVQIDGVMLVGSGSVASVLRAVSTYYFYRHEAEVDCVNNGEFWPGDTVQAYLSEAEMVTGVITSASFSFGLQARSRLKLALVEGLDAAVLTIIRMWEGTQIGLEKYLFPEGYAYDIPNPFVDWSGDGHRYIFRPLTESVQGVMPAGEVTVTVNYAIALDHYEGILHIVSADKLTESNRTHGEDEIKIVEVD